MFGYIKPFQPELKVRELEEYKAVYCGLCKELGRSFGLLARFTLSYDFAFLAMLATALEDDICPETERCRCIAHPFCKRLRTKENAAVSFSARIAVISVYYKLLDDRADRGFAKKLVATVLMPFAKAARKKALAFADGRSADAAALEMTEAQRKLEAEHCKSPDAAAEPTANFLSAVFSLLAKTTEESMVLSRLGYLFGRYIYFCDALDDLEQDKKSGDYNPFLYSGNSAAFDAKASIFLTTAEIESDFDLLTLCKYKEILSNIFTLGLRAEAQHIITKQKGGDEHGTESL